MFYQAGNPTGVSTTLERKKAVLKICNEHNILILEDDPYFYLQYDDYIPSYFSLDVQGRVLRFDSLSKILSAGLRVGWVSGPAELVERIVLHGMVSNLHPSGMSQTIALTLFKHWGHDGFLAHVKTVAAFYESKRNDFVELCNHHLTGLATWEVPKAGMFVWLKLNNVKDSKILISEKAMAAKVLLVPGVEFLANPSDCPYVRASFSTATREQMDIALGRLAVLLKVQ